MKHSSLLVLVDYFFITLGAFIMAVGIGVFLVDAKVVPGGVTGLSMAIHYLTQGKIPVGLCMWIFNIPLFIWGIKKLGRSFGMRTFYGFTTNSLFIDLVRGEYIPSFRLQDTTAIKYLMTHDFFFLVLLGAIFLGTGLGLIFKFKGSTAGSDIVAAIANKYWNIKPGVMIMIVDFFVIILAGIVIAVKNLSPSVPVLILVFYALLLLFISGYIIDLMIFGFDYARSAFIFTRKPDEIVEAIFTRLQKGATLFPAKGAYKQEESKVIFTVIRRRQVHKLQQIINEIDPKAFMTLSNIYEVRGEGFGTRGDIHLEFLQLIQQLTKKKPPEKESSL